MNYIIQVNSVTVNGRTYVKGEVVSGVRFSEGQVKDLTDSKSIAPEPKAEVAATEPDAKTKK